MVPALRPLPEQLWRGSEQLYQKLFRGKFRTLKTRSNRLVDLFQMCMLNEKLATRSIMSIILSGPGHLLICRQLICIGILKTLMGRVLTNRVDTQQEITICMAELLEKMERVDGKVNSLIKKITWTDPSSSDTSGDPQPPDHTLNIAEWICSRVRIQFIFCFSA